MTRGTTPNLIFNFCKDFVLSEAEKIIVTFSQNGKTLFNKEADIASDVNEQKLTIRLSQEDTLLMKAGSYVQFQVRLLVNGEVFATPIYKSIVYDSLSDDILVASDTATSSTDETLDGDNINPCFATATCQCNEICATVGDVMKLKGKDGFSTTISVKQEDEATYILTVKDVNGEYNTPNLLGVSIPKSEKGVANGVATLDENGYISSSQLPSRLNDVEEYDSFSNFPPKGESGKIYTARDTKLLYLWGGTSYALASSPLALGENAQTAYAGDKGKKNSDDISVLQKNATALDDKIDGIKGIYRFSESSVSSSFSGVTELYKEDLIGDGTPREGESVLFPDNKSNVMFIGTITHVNDETYTVDNIKYINDSLKASGDWVMGVTANFPEMYNYNGGTWLCLTRDVTTEPVKGKEWFCISEPATVKSVAGKTGEVTLETKDITDFDDKITEVTNDFVREQELGELASKDTVGTTDINDNSITDAKLDNDLQTAISKAGTAVQPEELSDVATSGEYKDLSRQPSIPRPIYFKLNGDLMQDTGGVDTDYTLAISNLTPQSPAPVVGDIVVFRTSDYAYVGTVTAGIIVTVKLQIGGLIY